MSLSERGKGSFACRSKRQARGWSEAKNGPPAEEYKWLPGAEKGKETIPHWMRWASPEDIFYFRIVRLLVYRSVGEQIWLFKADFVCCNSHRKLIDQGNNRGSPPQNMNCIQQQIVFRTSKTSIKLQRLTFIIKILHPRGWEFTMQRFCSPLGIWDLASPHLRWVSLGLIPNSSLPCVRSILAAILNTTRHRTRSPGNETH